MLVVYLKPREALTHAEHACVETLAAHKHHVVVLAEDPYSPANIDVFMDGKLWEMKNVGNGRHSINDRLRDAYHKWRRLGLPKSETRVVVSSFGATRSESAIISELHRRKSYLAGLVYVSREQRLVEIKN